MNIKRILALFLGFALIFSFMPVEAQSPLVVSAQLNRSFVDNIDTVDVTATASGGKAPYTYAFFVTRQGTTGNVHATKYSSINTLKYRPNKLGVYQITVNVKDSSGRYTVAALDPIYVNSLEYNILAEIENTNLHVGDTIKVKSHVIGGEGSSFRYAYYVYKNGERIYYRTYNGRSTLNYRIKSPGIYFISSFVKDRNGTVKGVESEAFAVDVEPLKLSLNVLSVDHKVGLPITASSNAVGVGSPMRYAFYVYHDGQTLVHKTDYSFDPSFSYTPQLPGRYVIIAYARDSFGSRTQVKSAPMDIPPAKVNAVEPPSQVTEVVTLEEVVEPTNTPAPVIEVPQVFSILPMFDFGEKTVGSKANISLEVSGGKEPYTYACAIIRDGQKVVSEKFVDNPVFSYSYSKPGVYVFDVFAKDSTGAMIKQSSREVEVIAVPEG